MSAFSVTTYHLNVMLMFAQRRRGAVFVYADGVSRKFNLRDTDEYQAVGDVLRAANDLSVTEKYREPDAVGPQFAPMYVNPLGADARAVQVLKACDCYDYQACEVDDYDRSLAAKIVDSIRRMAIDALPGYEDAEWALDGPTHTVETVSYA